MIYETIERAQENVLDALYREGGELSYSELVLAALLPYDVVVSVVEQLEEKGRVETHREKATDIGLVHLR